MGILGGYEPYLFFGHTYLFNNSIAFNLGFLSIYFSFFFFFV